ncbi:MAG: hypothetical protein WCK89_08630 [bacterium]
MNKMILTVLCGTAVSAPLKEGESFNCQLAAPVKVFGVRVTGNPTFGGHPNQAFSTCAELQAFAK